MTAETFVEICKTIAYVAVAVTAYFFWRAMRGRSAERRMEREVMRAEKAMEREVMRTVKARVVMPDGSTREIDVTYPPPEGLSFPMFDHHGLGAWEVRLTGVEYGDPPASPR